VQDIDVIGFWRQRVSQRFRIRVDHGISFGSFCDGESVATINNCRNDPGKTVFLCNHRNDAGEGGIQTAKDV
jgi:hypothetical protein